MDGSTAQDPLSCCVTIENIKHTGKFCDENTPTTFAFLSKGRFVLVGPTRKIDKKIE